MNITNETIARLRDLLAKAPRWPEKFEPDGTGYYRCPACDGEGVIEGDLVPRGEFVPSEIAVGGVQVYGIGDGVAALQDVVRDLLTAAPALLAAAERGLAVSPEWQSRLQDAAAKCAIERDAAIERAEKAGRERDVAVAVGRKMEEALVFAAKERDEAAALLREVARNLENIQWPTEGAGREWCDEHSTYLRGQAAALLMLPPESMRKLESCGKSAAPVHPLVGQTEPQETKP